jgi:hypothetical protein
MTTVRTRHTIQTGGTVRTAGSVWAVDLGALDERDYLHVALSCGLAVIVEDAPLVDEPALSDTIDINEPTDNDEG